MCQGLGPKKRDEISEIDRIASLQPRGVDTNVMFQAVEADFRILRLYIKQIYDIWKPTKHSEFTQKLLQRVVWGPTVARPGVLKPPSVAPGVVHGDDAVAHLYLGGLVRLASV